MVKPTHYSGFAASVVGLPLALGLTVPMFETPTFLMATFLAFPVLMAVLPFVVMGKVAVVHVLKWVAFAIAGVLVTSMLSAMLTNCSFQESLFLLRPTFECRPIPMLRAVFVSYVALIAGLAAFPFVALASILRGLKRPNPVVKRDAPQAARPLP